MRNANLIGSRLGNPSGDQLKSLKNTVRQPYLTEACCILLEVWMHDMVHGTYDSLSQADLR